MKGTASVRLDARDACAGLARFIPTPLDPAQTLPHPLKSRQALLQIRLRMRGRDHHPDSRLALGHRRIADGHGKETLLEEHPAESLRPRRLAEHDRRDRGRALAGVKADRLN